MDCGLYLPGHVVIRAGGDVDEGQEEERDDVLHVVKVSSTGTLYSVISQIYLA